MANNENDVEELVISDVYSKKKVQQKPTAPPLVAPTPNTTEKIEATELKDGINYVSNSVYHSDRKYLSSSVLKKVLESLPKYYDEYILGNKVAHSTSTQANFDVGTLTHTLILEPHLAEGSYNLYKGMRKVGREFEQFLASVKDPTLPCLSINQLKTATDMFEAFKSHEVARKLIQNGEPELTICGTLHGVPIKTRFDWINVEKGYIADVKTTGYGSDLESFKQTCEDFSYPLSGALYASMAEAYYGKPFKFYYIVLSKKDKTCDVYVTSERTMAQGCEKVKKACAKYLEAKNTNNWTDSVQNSTLGKSEQDVQNKPYIIREI